jgi:hypothetical protein
MESSDRSDPTPGVDGLSSPEGGARIRTNQRLKRRMAGWLLILLLGWLGLAYLFMPLVWKVAESRHPALDDLPNVTRAADGVPGDPLNVSLIGTEDDLVKGMASAKWYKAKPLSLSSDLKIAEATVFKRPDDQAPVSNLYLFGRKEDVAFEKPVGPDPRQRHHVRFWRTEKVDPDGRPVWIGSAAFDERVGFSHRTGQITHHIDGNVDQERDLLFVDLNEAGALSSEYVVPHFHKTLEGKNGGGDKWHTDGDLYVGVLIRQE